MSSVSKLSRTLSLLISLVFLIGCGSQPSLEQADRRSDSVALSSISATPDSLARPEKIVSKFPYKPRAEKAESKFVEMDPSQTGIDLAHIWNPPPEHRNLVNPIFGAGIAIGDYDDDGLLDVFVAQSTSAGRLFKNLGELKFKDVTREVGIDPTGMWASGTTFVDVNNDGRLDLYICGFDCPNRLYINQGSSFTEMAAEFGLDYHGSSVEMAFADYDCDGDLDAYLVTNYLKPKNENIPLQVIRRPGKAPQIGKEFRELFHFVKDGDKYRRVRGGQFDHLYRNDGGKFVDVTREVGIGEQPHLGLSANWWDYNLDGRPDLYVANDFMGPDILYRNEGPDESGEVRFSDVTSSALPHTPWFSMGSDFGDINNDGRLDYLASDMAGTNHYRDKLSMGNMSGPNSNAWFLNVPDPPQYMRNALYLNTGAEQFMEIAFLSSLAKTDWTWTVRLADLDNDGWQDVFFTNGMTRDLQNGDLLDQLRKLQEENTASADKTKSNYEIAQDFWEKQAPFRLENMAFRNQGDLKFKSVGSEWGLNHLGVSTGAAVGDLDNDGDLDLVVNGFEEPVRMYRNDLARENSIRVRLIGNESNRHGVGAMLKLNLNDNDQQVRYLATSRGFMSTSEPIAHFGIGKNSRAEQLVIQWPSGITQTITELEANHLYTIVEQGERASPEPAAKPMFAKSDLLENFDHRELEFDDFLYQPLLPNKYSQLGPGMSIGDIDNDGDEDIYLGGAAFHAGKVLVNDKGQFTLSDQPAFKPDEACEDMGSLLFDADKDGDLDLYVVSGGVEFEAGDRMYQDRLYLNDGSGQFVKSDLLPEMKHSGSCVAASDFDKDGDIDLFVGGRVIPRNWPEAPTSVLLENTDGKFVIKTDTVIPAVVSAGMVTSAIWSDINGDDWSDLLVTYEFGPVRCFQNEQGQFREMTESAGLANDTGWFNSICGGDIDNDGDTDFVVGNFGLNTKYKADKEHPAFLYYGDFEGVGRKRIVEAKFEGDTCLPRRGLSCSSHAMPMIKEKTPTFHEFATSDLLEIYTDEKIEDAVKYEANNLESIILINDSKNGEVSFRLKALPRIAQASPIFGTSLVDVNSDGNLDLLAAQNFFGPQRETGYMDGGIGLLMLGDGTGSLTPVPAELSGIAITRDATSLVMTDLNGDRKVDFIVGKNNQAPEVYLNQTDTSLNKLDPATVLSPAPSSDGRDAAPFVLMPGKKIYVESGNGKRRLHEVTLGSGYLSQGSTAIYGNTAPN